jgi:ribosomal protein S18 acetylase RimI-like enzyme
MFRLEPMDEAAYAAWRGRVEHEYGQDKVRAGNWPAEDADRLSREAFDELIPQGLATPGHELRSMVNDTNERVGVVWFTVMDRENQRVTFIYDIEVDEAHRRRGYARQALAEVERYAAENGCVGVMLHVFGYNIGARELYRSEGFVETNVMMLKRVQG